MKLFDNSKYHKREIVTLALSVVIIGAIFAPYPGVNASHDEIFKNSEFHGYGTGSALITLNPSSGAVGTSVTVSGLNFIPSHPVVTKFDGHPVTIPSATKTDNSGRLTVTFIVPASEIGPHTVTASDGTNTASATFTITAHATTHNNTDDDHKSNDNKSNDNKSNDNKSNDNNKKSK
jgi:IPT/TIG domain